MQRNYRYVCHYIIQTRYLYMKKYFFVVTMALFAIVVSCTKNNVPNKLIKTEMPLQSLVNNNYFDFLISNRDTTQELGYRFSTNKPGKISSLGAYTPSKGNYRVTLWDNATKTLIDSTIIQVIDSAKFTYKTINPIVIEANKDYVISLTNRYTRSYFVLLRKNSVFSPTPVNIGGITIKKGVVEFLPNINISFPTEEQTITTRLNGIPDFVFEPTE